MRLFDYSQLAPPGSAKFFELRGSVIELLPYGYVEVGRDQMLVIPDVYTPIILNEALISMNMVNPLDTLHSKTIPGDLPYSSACDLTRATRRQLV